MSLTIEDEAIAMNLTLNIDLGKVDTAILHKEIVENFDEWKELLEFWQSKADKSLAIQGVFQRLYLEYLITL